MSKARRAVGCWLVTADMGEGDGGAFTDPGPQQVLRILLSNIDFGHLPSLAHSNGCGRESGNRPKVLHNRFEGFGSKPFISVFFWKPFCWNYHVAWLLTEDLTTFLRSLVKARIASILIVAQKRIEVPLVMLTPMQRRQSNHPDRA